MSSEFSPITPRANVLSVGTALLATAGSPYPLQMQHDGRSTDT